MAQVTITVFLVCVVALIHSSLRSSSVSAAAAPATSQDLEEYPAPVYHHHVTQTQHRTSKATKHSINNNQQQDEPSYALTPRKIVTMLAESRQVKSFFSWLFQKISGFFLDRSDDGGSVVNPIFRLGFLESFFKAKEMAAPLLVTLGSAAYAILSG